MKQRKREITPFRKFNCWLRLFSFAAVLTAQTAVSTMVSYGVVYIYDDEDDIDDRIPSRSRSTTSKSTTTSRTSSRVQEEDDPGSDGSEGDEIETNSVILDTPLINQVTLKEQYHQDYQVYEESLADLFFFYSNVGNGGITHESVILDIPQNLSYTIEMNGVPWSYVSGQPISNYGTYVVRLTGIEDTSVPFYEQKEYQAVFRFRIQAKPPKEETEDEEDAAEAVSGGQRMEWRSYTYDGIPLEDDRTQNTEDVFRVSAAAGTRNGQNTQGLTENDENEQTDERGTAADGSEPEDESGVLSEREEPSGGNDADAETNTENGGFTNGQSVEGEAGIGLSGLGNTGFVRRTQSYDSGAGKYQVTFPDGLQLVSNVPEGYIGPGPVELSVSPSAREGMVLYREDEEIEYISGEALTEPGHYRLELNGQPWSCTIAAYIHQSGIYPAPAGMRFASAVLDGEELALSSDRYVLMEEDGEYQFVLEGQDGEVWNTCLTKDTVSPQVQVTIKGGSASIQYLSEDIAQIRLEKDGELVEGFAGYAINTPGTYKLTVLDEAGNEAISQFTLTYRVNRYGVIAVVLMILVVIAGVVFVLHVKKTVNVR